MAKFGIQTQAMQHGFKLGLIGSLLLAASALSGCGKKGPLYLPQADNEQSIEQQTDTQNHSQDRLQDTP